MAALSRFILAVSSADGGSFPSALVPDSALLQAKLFFPTCHSHSLTYRIERTRTRTPVTSG
jgi:hypothetical protein